MNRLILIVITLAAVACGGRVDTSFKPPSDNPSISIKSTSGNGANAQFVAYGGAVDAFGQAYCAMPQGGVIADGVVLSIQGCSLTQGGNYTGFQWANIYDQTTGAHIFSTTQVISAASGGQTFIIIGQADAQGVVRPTFRAAGFVLGRHVAHSWTIGDPAGATLTNTVSSASNGQCWLASSNTPGPGTISLGACSTMPYAAWDVGNTVGAAIRHRDLDANGHVLYVCSTNITGSGGTLVLCEGTGQYNGVDYPPAAAIWTPRSDLQRNPNLVDSDGTALCQSTPVVPPGICLDQNGNAGIWEGLGQMYGVKGTGYGPLFYPGCLAVIEPNNPAPGIEVHLDSCMWADSREAFSTVVE